MSRRSALPYFRFSASILLRGQPHSASSSGSVSVRRVGEIGQEAEVQVLVAVGQEAHFQRLDQVLDVLRRS